MESCKYLIVIPSYNEADSIEKVVSLAVQYADVCVIDDASKDSTPQILEGLLQKYPNQLFVITHKKNTHIPCGIQDGMRFAVQNNYNYVITMDAGMSHDPDSLPEFISYTHTDLLIGRRIVTEGVPLYRKVISFLAAKVINYCISKSLFDILGPRIRDVTSGYRRYSQKAFTIIAERNLISVSFDFHMEALYVTYRNGGEIVEHGIHYKFSNSSFNSRVLKQAIRFAWTALKSKFTGNPI